MKWFTHTTILSEVATSAILRAHNSQFFMFAALPAPTPVVLVGVLTLTKIISDSAIDASTAVEKNRFLCFHQIWYFSARKSIHYLLVSDRKDQLVKSRLINRQR